MKKLYLKKTGNFGEKKETLGAESWDKYRIN